MIETDAMRKVINARRALISRNTFFGSVAMGLQLVEAPDKTQTHATDGKHLFFNPGLVENIPFLQEVAEVGHEVSHNVFGHLLNRGDRDPELWNQAGDYVINLVLKDDGFQLGADWLIDERFRSMTTEAVYAILKSEQDQGKPTKKPHQRSCHGMIEPSFDGGDPSDEQDSYAQGSKQEAAQDLRELVAASYQAAKMAGNLSASIERIVGRVLYPKKDWSDELRDLVTEITRDDYNWRRPAKRHLVRGLILPSLYNNRVKDLLFVIDTSASITQEHLAKMVGTTAEILEQAGDIRSTFMSVDTQVHNVQTFEPGEDITTYRPVGGGGTAFGPVFDAMKDMDQDFAGMFFLTDTFAMDWKMLVDPEIPVIWGVPVEFEKNSYEPIFGTKVFIE